MSLKMKGITEEAVNLLKQLIQIRSYSRQETATADLLASYLSERGFHTQRRYNNVWVTAGERDPDKPTLLLNSHHDTVEATSGWTKDPFTAHTEDGKLYGLGSNDAGGPLVSLLQTFLYFAGKDEDLPWNLIFLASAEEEVSGDKGVPAVLPELGRVDFGIVGEPTSMRMAVAERGLIVLDCTTRGASGHAARGEGVNALYAAMEDIRWFRDHQFEKTSKELGPVNMTVTQIECGTRHNVVPDKCRFVVDVRPNEIYSNEELLKHIRNNVQCEVQPRNMKRNASGISRDHPFVKKALSEDIKVYGSQTMSDQVHMSFSTVKMGPGDTRRSHTADEFIYLSEIEEGIQQYINLLNGATIK